MKRYLSLITVLLLSLFIMGMGDLGGKPEGSIPMPDKDFKATIVDINSVETVCNFVSINGKDFIKGKRGAATVTIPFENIKAVSISLSGDERDVNVELSLIEGKLVKLKVDGNSDVFGKTDFGTVKIKVREISKITFN
jgi:sporulation protein YlmC with PRC-barrel domain